MKRIPKTSHANSIKTPKRICIDKVGIGEDFDGYDFAAVVVLDIVTQSFFII